jgi:hypothetical protein
LRAFAAEGGSFARTSASRQGLFRPIANYVVAYAGLANMSTAFGWIRNAYEARQLSDPQFEPAHGPRNMIASSALDGVFIQYTLQCPWRCSAFLLLLTSVTQALAAATRIESRTSLETSL